MNKCNGTTKNPIYRLELGACMLYQLKCLIEQYKHKCELTEMKVVLGEMSIQN